MSDPGFGAIADALATAGWGTSEEFLPAAVIAALAQELTRHWEAGNARPAGVGTGSKHSLRSGVRSDHIVWLEAPGSTPAQRACLRQFELLRRALNRELQLGLFDVECHFALYPPGAFYRRHLDRFIGDYRRTLSCALYLNANWRAEDGGALRLYVPDGYRDVLPQAGTLVAFLSERFEHEVLATRRLRLSVTGWFRRRA